jgi:predicted transcriptional regulator
VQLATRISPDIAALIDAAAARTGYSKRNVIEQAIQQVWG